MYDVTQKDRKGINLEIIGEASVLKIFNVTESSKKGRGKKVVPVAGSRVNEGELDA